ncbi:MAG TPA: hypothetical protein VI279_11780 [Rhodocyclaceae bacterium]
MAVRKYLFVDDRWIAETHAVHRRPGRFEKHPLNPLLVADQPWEGDCIYCFGTCLEEGGRFRLWYQVYDSKAEDPRFRTAVGYAESTDGLHWEKPRVGVTHPRFGATNLVVLSSGVAHLYAPSVIRDDEDPDPARRYKMMLWDAMSTEDLARHGSPFPKCDDVPGWRGIDGEGLFVLTSSDGIAWRREPRPAIGSPSDASAFCRLADGSYLAAFKTSERSDHHFRVVAESTSADFAHWSAPRTVLQPDWRDPIGTEFYGMAPFDYCGNRLGLLWIYHNVPDDKRMDVQLSVWTAIDGWQRAADRATMLATGVRGEWDAGLVVTASSLQVSPPGDEGGIWLFYGGGNVRHDDSRYRRNGIGLARMRLDGFFGMEAGHFTGSLTLRPMLVPNGDLRLNLSARHGRCKISIHSTGDHRLLARSHVIAGCDDVSVVPTWDLMAADSWNEVVIVVIELQQAVLYGLEVQLPDDAR